MQHKSEVRVGGGKDVVIDKSALLRQLLDGLEIKATVKGYKSSEGDVTFLPEAPLKQAPATIADAS